MTTEKYVVSYFRLPEYAMVTIIAFSQMTSDSSAAYFIAADSDLLIW
jgi:hypothetical protein